MASQHFTDVELACRCGLQDCNALPIQPRALAGLEAVRVAYGRPLVIRSAARCQGWNTTVGGAPGSRHLHGDAFDVEAWTGSEKYHIVRSALLAGAAGIGIGKSFVHFDWRPRTPSAWCY